MPCYRGRPNAGRAMWSTSPRWQPEAVSPSAAAYAATKAGLTAVSEGLRREGIRHNIRVTDIQPAQWTPSCRRASPTNKARGPQQPRRRGLPDPPARRHRRRNPLRPTQPEHVDVNEILVRPTIQDQ
ncbi:MAG: hypothetical protein U5L11_03265 [Arhodomonas sp.]|nr:hypothetical protein [Arhodomonas sp.]